MNKYVNDRLQELHAERNALDDSESQLTEALEAIRHRKIRVDGAIEELRMLMASQSDRALVEELQGEQIPQDQPSPSHQS